MQLETSDNRGNVLEVMWETHREFLRRFLIALTRDIDLADDLLQESYLKARAGIENYRGGDPRAWLSAIVKNSFHSHSRLRYVRSEILLDDQNYHASGTMEDRLDLIEIRRAISDLPETQRRALVMKHYGGYNYEDIAAYMGCPTGTAKSRVSSALKRLREALAVPREEMVDVKCADLTERMLMDFIYDRMAESEKKQVEEHLARCSSCRERTAEVGLVLRALDAVEVDSRGTFIIELHEDGTASSYMFMTSPNNEHESVEELVIGCSPLSAAFVNGHEARIEQIEGESKMPQMYKLHLAQRVGPGEQVDLLMIGLQAPEEVTKDLGGGLHAVDSIKLVFDQEFLYLLAVRLPAGAVHEGAMPEPQEVRGNRTTTIVWRDVLKPNVKREFSLQYRLK